MSEIPSKPVPPEIVHIQDQLHRMMAWVGGLGLVAVTIVMAAFCIKVYCTSGWIPEDHPAVQVKQPEHNFPTNWSPIRNWQPTQMR